MNLKDRVLVIPKDWVNQVAQNKLSFELGRIEEFCEKTVCHAYSPVPFEVLAVKIRMEDRSIKYLSFADIGDGEGSISKEFFISMINQAIWWNDLEIEIRESLRNYKMVEELKDKKQKLNDLIAKMERIDKYYDGIIFIEIPLQENSQA